MERTKLRGAREKRGLSQEQLADAIGCRRETISNWERGLEYPQPYWILKICAFFEVKDPKDLDIVRSAQTEDDIEMIIKLLERFDRRQILAILGQVPAFASVDISTLFSPTAIIAPEQFLSQCQAAIDTCWYLLNHNGIAIAEHLLEAYTHTLSDLAIHLSPYQHQAALTAVETQILRGMIAMHNLNPAREERLYLEAVRFGRLSGDGRIQAVALGYLGFGYSCHLKLPKSAIANFNEALAFLDDDAFLQKSVLYIGLADAYAQDKETRNIALDMLEQARMNMSEHPELDPLYRLIDCESSEFDQIEGKMYLHLHKHFPNDGYAQKAYDVCERGTKRTIVDRTHSLTLIHKADAARAIGDLDEFAQCLEDGAVIALQIGSQNRISEAVTALQRTPRKWQKEEKYQRLRKILVPGKS